MTRPADREASSRVLQRQFPDHLGGLPVVLPIGQGTDEVGAVCLLATPAPGRLGAARAVPAAVRQAVQGNAQHHGLGELHGTHVW